MVQMIASDEVENISAGRRLIAESFDLKRYLPETNKYGDILKEYQQFLTHKAKEMV
ncbi:Rhamnulokinase [Lactiplantibacillus plantarum subsp. plantarum]|uniref:Rhamnulokinase n=2 Tax=Lactiplantibacillus TaxID=2767842 RepID=A0A2S3UAI3_LACPN|nr:Rhamnulokinase [Lactiplantibacillus plantarum subsp. plantarum]